MKRITSDDVKEIARQEGADLCGISPVSRFKDAPEGFKPTDIFPGANSVLVFAKRLPEAAFKSKSLIPYTLAMKTVQNDVFSVTCNIANRLQDLEVIAVPIPSEPYEYWDAEKKEGRGILSLRHSGYLCGLGVIGRNTLLINEKFGDRIVLGALLLDISLEGDPIATYEVCRANCNACIKSCPVNALNGKTVVQKLCRPVSEIVTPKGYEIYACNSCRVVCPSGKGICGVR